MFLVHRCEPRQFVGMFDFLSTSWKFKIWITHPTYDKEQATTFTFPPDDYQGKGLDHIRVCSS